MKKPISVLLLLVFCLSFTVTSFSQDKSGINYADSDAVLEIVMSYLTDEDGVKRFDVDAAIENGEDEGIILIGERFNDFSSSMKKDPRQARLEWPIHGNWCGPGHSGPESPVDKLDEACKEHDLCYADNGYFDCDCDEDLIWTIRYYRDNGDFERGVFGIQDNVTLIMSYAIEAYFLVAPCVTH